MVTLQDISVQLMKPAKDLADWKFPLSQILEEYYALLEGPCNINFGEAALVLQNSANVYVRRIERLFNETEVLKQTFFGYEDSIREEEIKKSMRKEKKIFKEAYVDFENFIIIDLEKDIGKNIDKKNQLQEQKKVKLLSHRFTQLENNTTQLCIPIQVYDVLGEVIGKKYDFRCNQAINTSGMLVDELTSHDFTYILDSCIQRGRNSLSCSELKTPDTEISKCHLATLSNDNESVTSVHEEFEDEHSFSSQIDNVSSLNETEIIEKENMINKDNDIPFINTNILSPVTSEKNFFKGQHTQLNKIQNINDQNFSTQIPNEINQIKKKCQGNNSDQINKIEREYQTNDKNMEQFQTNDQIDHYKQLSHVSKEDSIISKEVAQINALDNVRWKEGLLSIRKRGNQGAKISIYSVNDINEFDWKPMPLIQGIKNVFSDNTSILKLPKYISLLETKFDLKKRKLTSKLHKPECLTKLVLQEAELSTKKDIISQEKPKFKYLQKQELEDFMKNFDECLNGIERENDTSQYETMTNVTIDLLGFSVFQNQNNFIEDNVEDILSRTSSPTNCKPQSTIYQNSLDMIEKSPNLCNNWCESSVSEINLPYSLPDYQTLIEDKMKKIFEESDVATELDQTVAKWHASLQPKLSEAEIRPAFRIHDYASHIIGKLQALDQKKINFDHVVRDKPACEVARYFLASLQLANTYNVEIKMENSDHSIEIALLDGKNCEKS